MTLSDVVARTIPLAEAAKPTALRRFLRQRSQLALMRLVTVAFAGRDGVTPARVFDAVREATDRPQDPDSLIAVLLATERLADRLTAGLSVLTAAGTDLEQMPVE